MREVIKVYLTALLIGIGIVIFLTYIYNLGFSAGEDDFKEYVDSGRYYVTKIDSLKNETKTPLTFYSNITMNYPQSIHFYADEVEFKDKRLDLRFSNLGLFQFDNVDFLVWNIGNNTYYYQKVLQVGESK